MEPKRAKNRVENHPLVKTITNAATLIGAALLLLGIWAWLKEHAHVSWL